MLGHRAHRVRRGASLCSPPVSASSSWGVGYALFEGYARAPIALVKLLYFVYPLLTAVGAAVLFREELGVRAWRRSRSQASR